MTSIKWGILGTGSIAKAFADALQETEGELVAVASQSLKRAEDFSKPFNCSAVEGYKSLISLPEVEAIYIATPHPSHFELSAECLRNKKAVLCEKPMTINATETMALIDISRKNNTLLMEAFMYKIHPQTQKLMKVIQENLTSPLNIRAEFCFSVDVPESHRLVNKELGGGSILDIGCYPMSISRHAVGAVHGKNFMNPVSIKGQGELNSQEIDLNASATLVFEDGSVAEVKSATNLSSASDVEITDGQTTVVINQPWHCGEFTDRKSQIKLKKANVDEELIDITTDKGLYALEIDHFSETFKDQSIESSLIPHNDSHGNMIALDTWRKALKVVYDEDRGERRKFPIISQENSRESLPALGIPGLDKELSRVVFGCDNQSDTNHAFAMFDHFYKKGGNVFDTAYIYNNGKSDFYLGSWIESRDLREKVVVLGKGAHTPDCLPEKIRPQLEETLS
ncbi:MAG: oxidoreductase, partial [Euryarchaeota archaeon]|nr:oxidoreductase [Euryarchaeota archaeon]